MDKLKSFNEFEQEPDNEDLYNKYDDLVADLIFRLSENIEILSEDIQEIVYDLYDVSNEIFGYDNYDYDNDIDDTEDEAFDNVMAAYGNDGGYDEDTTTSNISVYKTPLKYYDDEDEIDEVAAKKVKRNRAQRLKSRREYRKKKAKLRVAGKRLRRSAKFKKYMKKKKRMAKRGKTAGGARKKTFI